MVDDGDGPHLSLDMGEATDNAFRFCALYEAQTQNSQSPHQFEMDILNWQGQPVAQVVFNPFPEFNSFNLVPSSALFIAFYEWLYYVGANKGNTAAGMTISNWEYTLNYIEFILAVTN